MYFLKKKSYFNTKRGMMTIKLFATCDSLLYYTVYDDQQANLVNN